ncbi:gas vesicle protein GvpD [Kineobactrum salinum]|uniref:non-specific serine/threonine protein kinase n=1 Tax=Kineobactrum salinum TaxID=2708301 RepID=A0A6C0TXR3_9GAMM|nr:gas vesicle protein GvpD [Kineobactrum salinum]QIB64566.1 AAA family ATPase [Kineobactrum salinum]
MSSYPGRLSSGLPALDDVLNGGLIPGASYLIRGGPGQGKTTLGCHFLSSVGTRGAALFIGFQEPEDQLRTNAEAVGIDVSNVTFLSLAPDERFFTDQQGYDVFAAADVEQEPLAEAVTAAMERSNPSHVFVDSMTQLRFLSSDLYQYRKQVLSLLRYFRDRGATVLFTSERSSEISDEDLQFIADGVITLDVASSGSFLEVSKFRGSGFMRGAHQMRVGGSGLELFPCRLPPRSNKVEDERWRYATGVTKIDEMLYGGLEAGTISLITGPSGVGKSTLASLFATHAAEQGRKSAFYLFEEEQSSLLYRASSLAIPLKKFMDSGLVAVQQVEPLRYLADEFASMVHSKVEAEGVELVILDSIAGFELVLGEGEQTKSALHAFAKGLSRRGISVILVNEIEALTGQFRISEKGISYLSDNVIFLRFMEADGELKKSIGVLKKRLSPFDSKMYTYQIAAPGFRLDESVAAQGLQGVLDGQQVVND